jgi:hypothetical protein
MHALFTEPAGTAELTADADGGVHGRPVIIERRSHRAAWLLAAILAVLLAAAGLRAASRR